MTTDASLRPYGYGSLYRRASDGLWIAAVELPRRRGEKRVRRTWSHANREMVEAQLHAFRADHPPVEHPGRAEHMRRARTLATHTTREWWALVRASGMRCYYCRCKLGPWDLTQDHKTPVSRDGSDGTDNLALTCQGCNTEKGAMTESEFGAWRTRDQAPECWCGAVGGEGCHCCTEDCPEDCMADHKGEQ